MEPEAESNDVQARIAAWEAEVNRLLQVEAAAKEARAYLEGRRPGFAPSYPLEVLRAALASSDEAAPLPVIRSAVLARRRKKPR